MNKDKKEDQKRKNDASVNAWEEHYKSRYLTPAKNYKMIATITLGLLIIIGVVLFYLAKGEKTEAKQTT